MHARDALLSLPLFLASAGCASVHFEPATETSGTFRSSAVAFTFLGKDYPQSALLLARANASDMTSAIRTMSAPGSLSSGSRL